MYLLDWLIQYFIKWTSIWRGDFCFFALLVWGAYTWRGLFLEFYGSTQIQYKNVNYYIVIFSQRLFD